jgi:hypothetical protein
MGWVIVNFKQSLTITAFVFVMMILVDYINVLTGGRIQAMARVSPLKQYIFAAFLGILPGCLGTFMGVSLYVHGFMSIGALCALMTSTTGDEAYIMFAMFPGKALFLNAVLFGLAVVVGFVFDRVAGAFKIKPCDGCKLTEVHHGFDAGVLSLETILGNIRKMSLSRFLMMFVTGAVLFLLVEGSIGEPGWGWEKITFVVLMAVGFFIVASVPHHYLQEHLWGHIARKHIWRVFLWTFGALVVVHLALETWNMESFVKAHMFAVLLSAALVGLVPESGPHLLFVMMYAGGVIPFSVLMTSSIVQDGHGMLPLLSYTVRDALIVKVFKLALGLAVGSALYFMGM